MVYCPGNIHQLIAVTEEAVTWREPEFSDNVKVARVESSRKSGDIFPLGSTNVEYTAFDETGNLARCSFVVNLKRKSFAQRILLRSFAGMFVCNFFNCLFVCLFVSIQFFVSVTVYLFVSLISICLFVSLILFVCLFDFL